MFQDVRYGLRMLTKNPGFTVVVVLMLALGIGANAALFSVVDGVLLNPLPYPEPDQLVTIHQSKPNFETGAIPYPNFLDMQRQNGTFSSMAISRSYAFTLVSLGDAERVSARLISADFFSVLGLKPALGRTFVAADDRDNAEPVVLIGARLWARKFGSASDVLGKAITLDDKTYSIVGVIPTSFNVFTDTDVYVPIALWNGPALKNRGVALGLHGIGRLKPGVTIEQAQTDLNKIMSDLAAAYPATNKGNGARVIALKERMVGSVRPTLLMLLGAVGFVLLIACVNVSNLMLARSTGRTREFAIRAALGAGKWRLLRQSFIESILLAVVGGALGLGFAAWGTKAALKALPTALSRAEEVGLNFRVLIFTLGISLLTGILTGIAPALKTSHEHFNETLKEAGRGVTGIHARAQGIFVAVEMALALVLLIGAGLMVRSLDALWKVNPGFQPDNVVTFDLNLPPTMRTSTPDANRNFLRQLGDKLNSTPGVKAFSFSAAAAPLQNEDDLFFWIEGEPKPASTSEMHMALVYIVDPTYLSAMGIPLKKGRFFTNEDNERAPRVAVIDETLARQRFGDQEPLRKRIKIGDDEASYEIVGVVGHVKQWGLDSDDRESLQAQLYLPFRALPDNELTGPGAVGGVVRSDGNIGPSFLSSIRHELRSQSSQTVISNTQTMTEVIAESLAQRRFLMIILGSFAAVALLLASLGIYGVVSYLVGQRTHELGIRIALGAKRTDILRLVLVHGMKMVIAGVATGLAAAFLLTRLMTKVLYGVGATDPTTFGIIAMLLTLVALLACYVPARRATKVDPLVALRYE
ncbi:MAG: ABC transporter permease [Acidobacteria bacterium]|nr:MAG: ABC transporter permease [Acidobacteriota bacterium]